MATDYLKSYGDLQQELDNAKDTLTTLNDNIRRIIGRSPKDLRNDKFKSHVATRNDNDRPHQKAMDPKYKRRNNDGKSVFTRLSAPPPRSSDDEPRPRLHSRVIRELPTRQEIVAAQGIDSESRARNRRMFGSLLGTLQKFCQEESRLKQKEDKKAQIEKKLEEQQLHEKETLKKERELLFLDRKRKQLEIKKLESKMNRLKDFEVWEASTTHFHHYIKTKTKPHVYFKPRLMSQVTEKLLSNCQKSLDSIKVKKRNSLNKEFDDLENNLKIHAFDNQEQFESIANEDLPICKDNVEDKNMHHNNLNSKNIKKEDADAKENKKNGSIVNTSAMEVDTVENNYNEVV